MGVFEAGGGWGIGWAVKGRAGQCSAVRCRAGQAEQAGVGLERRGAQGNAGWPVVAAGKHRIETRV